MIGPEPSFEHISRLSDRRGTFEHADHTTPRREHGYCTDDMARLLVVTSREPGADRVVAGLQLAALSLRDHNDPAAFIDNFSGGVRDIADYLANDVLDQQPATLRDFLLASSVLERMDARACEAVTQNPDSQQMLEDLERENLFIIPLDEDRRWYRYHALFRDFLARQRCRRRRDARCRGGSPGRRACCGPGERGLIEGWNRAFRLSLGSYPGPSREC